MPIMTSETAVLLTAAVVAQHQIPMTVEGAEKVALFHKDLVFFLDLHLSGGGAQGISERGASAAGPQGRR